MCMLRVFQSVKKSTEKEKKKSNLELFKEELKQYVKSPANCLNVIVRTKNDSILNGVLRFLAEYKRKEMKDTRTRDALVVLNLSRAWTEDAHVSILKPLDLG